MIKKSLFFNYDIPLSLDLIELDGNYNYWSENLKIIYVIEGEINLNNKNQNYSLCENNIFIINSYSSTQIYNKNQKNVLYFEFSINSVYINKIYRSFLEMEFFYDKNSEKNLMIDCLIEIIHIISQKRKEKENFILFEKVLNLCKFLVENYRICFNNIKRTSSKKYLTKILEILEDNYNDENFNISKISKKINLTSQYILKLFRKNYGIGLTEYLNNLRVKKSLKDLINTNKLIVEIAIENGFASNKSYHRIFKKMYNTTPGQFRKIKKESTSENNLKFNFDKILKKLDKRDSNLLTKTSHKEIVINNIDMKNFDNKKLTPYWRKILSLGKAFEGLKGEVQEQIKEITSEIKFEYIKINSIFNDELYIYNEDKNGKSYYNFAYIDKLIDFFISLKLKPYINIGFMPKHLKSEEYYVVSSNVSYPKNLNKWKELISNLFNHFLEKYKEQVFEWKFEIWNNPNLYKMYWYENEKKFFNFYKETFCTIKKISKKFKVGGPTGNMFEDHKFLENFLNNLKENNMRIDFFSFSNYNIKNTDININHFKDWKFKYYSYETMNNIIKKVSKKIKTTYFKDIEIIVSEWNTSPYYLDLIHDTCYMSAYIIDTIVNNFSFVDALSYWTATETRLGNEIFFGGLGLFTINGLKKASYNAFLLLNKIGDNLIAKDKNYFITSKKDSYQILLYNYVHYNSKYQNGNFDIITPENRYNAFEEKSEKEIILNFENILSGEYILKKYFLNKNSGSVFDAWTEMGSPETITDEVYKYLKSKETMKFELKKILISKEKITIKEKLKAHESIFIELIKTNL